MFNSLSAGFLGGVAHQLQQLKNNNLEKLITLKSSNITLYPLYQDCNPSICVLTENPRTRKTWQTFYKLICSEECTVRQEIAKPPGYFVLAI